MAISDIPNRTPAVVAIAILMVILTTTATALRFMSRKMSGAGYCLDDWVILAALPFTWSNPIGSLVVSHFGFGKHLANIPHPHTALTMHLKNAYSQALAYFVALGLIKTSVLLFYARIFPGKQLRMTLWMLFWFTWAWVIVFGITSILQCSPVHKAWDPLIPGDCVNLDRLVLGNAIPNITSDIILVLLPVRLVWRLQLPRSQKIALCGVFLMSGFVIIISIIRLTSIFSTSVADATWNFVGIGIWSSLEPAFGLISACLPSISYLFKQAVIKLSSHPVTHNRKSKSSVAPTNNPHGAKPYRFTRLDDLPLPVDGKYNAQAYTGVLGQQGALAAQELGTPLPLNAIRMRRDVDLDLDLDSEAGAEADIEVGIRIH